MLFRATCDALLAHQALADNYRMYLMFGIGMFAGLAEAWIWQRWYNRGKRAAQSELQR